MKAEDVEYVEYDVEGRRRLQVEQKKGASRWLGPGFCRSRTPWPTPTPKTGIGRPRIK